MVIENLKKQTMEQVLQAELMIEFTKSKKVSKQEEAKKQAGIAEKETRKEANEDFLKFLNSL